MFQIRINQKIRWQVIRWCRNTLLIIGVITLSYSGYEMLDARIYQAEQTREFEKALKSETLPGIESPAIAVKESSPVGRIEISQIGLAAMILEGTSAGTLNRAVGHIQGTPLPGEHGNIALAGHRDTFFRGLRKIRPDDEITLTTLNGTYHYLVESTKVVEPEETEVLDADADDILTLVTCYPFNFIGSAPKRFIVRARKSPLTQK